MIVVHGFAPIPGLASPSPFCLKLETWLRLVGLPYRTARFSPFEAPRGKAPYVRLPDGRLIADSSTILETLVAEGAPDLDAGLTADERARAVLIQRTVEDHLYHALLWFRWVADDGFAILQRTYFEAEPAPVRWLLPRVARRAVRRATWAQGVARAPRAEIAAGARADLDALACQLGDRPYLLGDLPHTVDATVWATLANLHLGPFPDELQAALRAHSNLVAYVDRIRSTAWSSAA